MRLPNGLRILLSATGLVFCWFLAAMFFGSSASVAAESEPEQLSAPSIVSSVVAPLADSAAPLAPVLSPVRDTAQKLVAAADAAATPVVQAAEPVLVPVTETLTGALPAPVGEIADAVDGTVDELLDAAPVRQPVGAVPPVLPDLPTVDDSLLGISTAATASARGAAGDGFDSSEPAAGTAGTSAAAPVSGGAPASPDVPSAPLRPSSGLSGSASGAPAFPPQSSTGAVRWLLPAPLAGALRFLAADDSLPASPILDGTSTPD